MRLFVLALLALVVAPASVSASPGSAEARAESFFAGSTAGSNHTSNWAVLVDTSRYWFNYRHVANTLSFYRTVKRLGIPDERIVLMLADDMACNPRNPFPGRIFGNVNHAVDLYGDDIEVDYRGYEVTPTAFLRVLTDRHPPGTPRSKRLLTDAGSNVLIYLTGHGGDEFLKFQDQEEILSEDVADALSQMRAKRRYAEILFIADTCQASTLAEKFRSPNVLAIGSSEKGENSYSHHVDRSVGLSVVDRFTYHTLEFMERDVPDARSTATARDWFAHLRRSPLRSNARPRTENYARALESVRVADFFAAVTRAAPSARKTEGWRPPREERRGGDDAEGRGGRGHRGATSEEWGDRAWVREPREAYEKLAVALGRPS